MFKLFLTNQVPFWGMKPSTLLNVKSILKAKKRVFSQVARGLFHSHIVNRGSRRNRTRPGGVVVG